MSKWTLSQILKDFYSAQLLQPNFQEADLYAVDATTPRAPWGFGGDNITGYDKAGLWTTERKLG